MTHNKWPTPEDEKVTDYFSDGFLGLPLAWIVSTHAQSLGGLRALWLAVLVTHVGVAAAYVIWFRMGRWIGALAPSTELRRAA